MRRPPRTIPQVRRRNAMLPHRVRAGSLWIHSASLILLFWAVFGPARVRGDEPARSLARLIPARGLTRYVEYDGLDAHSVAWKASAAAQILSATPAGTMMAGAAGQAFDNLNNLVLQIPLTGRDVVAVQEHVVHHGFAMATIEDSGKYFDVFIVRKPGQARELDWFHNLLQALLKPDEGKPLSAPAQVRGRTMNVFQKLRDGGGAPGAARQRVGPSWWLEGDLLLLVNGPTGSALGPGDDKGEAEKDLTALHVGYVDRILDVIDGKAPNALTSAGLALARAHGRDIGGFEPNGLFFTESLKGPGVLTESLTQPGEDVAADSIEYAIAEALGVSQARRIIARWGFRGKALIADFRFDDLGADATKAGLLDNVGFRKDRLLPIPRHAGAFVVGSPRRHPDPQMLATIFEGATVKPEYVRHYEALKLALADAKNRQTITDLFDRLGPTWCMYASPGGKSRKDVAPTLLAGVQDRARLERALDAMASQLNSFLREQEFGKGVPTKPEDPQQALVLQRLPQPGRGFLLTSPDNRVPWLSETVQPTIQVGKSVVVFAANPLLAREAIACEQGTAERWEPSGETAQAFASLPEKLALLVVGNPRDSCWPEAIVSLCRAGNPERGEARAQSSPTELLSLLGIEPVSVAPPGKQNGKPIRAEDLRALIFPSVFAIAIDDRGRRILSLEALPFSCVGAEVTYKQKGFSKSISIDPSFAPGR